MTTSPARTGLRSGIDTSSLDPAVRPQDDLFRHVNGRWLAEHEIPADRAMDGAFRLLHDQTEAHVRAIITELGEHTSADGRVEAGRVDAAAQPGPGGGCRHRDRLRARFNCCLLYTSPSPRDGLLSRMPSS